MEVKDLDMRLVRVCYLFAIQIITVKASSFEGSMIAECELGEHVAKLKPEDHS